MSDLHQRIAAFSPAKQQLLKLRLTQRGMTLPEEQHIPRNVISGRYQPSFAQQRLWFLQQLEPEVPAYNMPKAFQISGDLNIQALRRTLTTITDRHATFRTNIITEDGNPIAVIADEWTFELPLLDLRGQADQKPVDLQQLMKREIQRPFNLASDLKLRGTVFRIGEADYILLLVNHHIGTDYWSTGILYQELGLLYATFTNKRPVSLPDLPINYADFAIWQREQIQGEKLEKQFHFWQHVLAGELPGLDLPTDRPRTPVQTYQGDRHTFTLSQELTNDLKILSTHTHATLFMTLLAAFSVLLHRYTDQEDILIGTPIAGRQHPETRHVIGCFFNTLALRAHLSGNLSFQELLGQIRERTIAAYTHQDIPFEYLVEKLQIPRQLDRPPIFQVMFDFLNVPENPLSLPDLHVERLDVHNGSALFDLSWVIREVNTGLHVTIEYNTALFDAATISRMAGHFQMLLKGITMKPSARISELPLLTEAERHQILVEWNDTYAEYPHDRCIHEMFEEQVEQRPDAVAAIFEDDHLTYRELNVRANQLAHYLRKQGVGPEVLVGICVERSLEMIVGLLGILKSGGAYVPIDPAYPGERIAYMLEDSNVALLLTQETCLSQLPEMLPQILCLDRDWGMTGQVYAKNPNSGVTTDSLAYVIYTSGSTGTPKGVQVEHRSLSNFLDAMQVEPGIMAQDRLLTVSTISFDIAALELYLPLVAGAAVVLTNREEATDGLQLIQLLSYHNITMMQATPATWRLLIDSGWKGQPGLKILCGGEALPQNLAQRLVSCGDSLWNLYGPTETTIWSTVYQVKNNAESDNPNYPEPIGHPIKNTQIYILDNFLQPVPIGVTGELYIGGNGLARGYLHHPELNAARFIPNPFHSNSEARLYRVGDLARYLPDGNIEFLGRCDHQVKFRGFRIELGEIETMLAQHPNVQEAVILLREDFPDEKRLVAYIIKAKGEKQKAKESEFHDFLMQKLPKYMIPSAFVFLQALPLTPNGKVDRCALPAPDTNRSDLDDTFIAPATPFEELLVGIWKEVLRQEPIGIHDNFFALGGHSLLASQVIARVNKTLQIELSLRSLFDAPTISGLVQFITAHRRALQEPLPPLLRTVREKPCPLSFAQQRIWFFEQFAHRKAVYNIPFAFRLNGVLDVAALEHSLHTIMQRHEILRAHFSTTEDGQLIQVIDPLQGSPLLHIDLQTVPESEREAKIWKQVSDQTQYKFDLSRDKLFRVVLWRLKPNEHILLFLLHHIVADGWSLGILWRELSLLYASYSSETSVSLPDLSVQYLDFAFWQRQCLPETVLGTQLAYWKSQLANASMVLEIPTDFPRPTEQRYEAAHHSILLSHQLVDELEALSLREHVTLFMTMLTAFQTLLFRYTGQEDIIVGSPIAGRRQVETENLIGCFINMLALRTDFSGNPTFCEVLERVRTTTLEAYTHQDVPFEYLVEHLQVPRDLSRMPVFQVVFDFLNVPESDLTLPELNVTSVERMNPTTMFDMLFYLRKETDSLKIIAEYNTSLFESGTIQRLLEHFQTLLEGIIADSNQHISELPLLTEAERQQILVEWNDTDADYPDDKCVHELFEEQAEQTPDAVAVVFQEQHLSYRELNVRANQLAHYLRKQGVGPEVLVGICVERSLEMTIGLLGILKAGGTYVPIDPAYPRERIAYMLEDSNVALLLTQETCLSQLPETLPQIFCLDRDWGMTGQVNANNPNSGVTTDNLAYVIYTSGSTGTPKGVALPHRTLTNLIAWQLRQTKLSIGAMTLQFAPLSFDVSMQEYFTTWCSGGTLLIVPEEMRRDMDCLARIMVKHQVARIFLPFVALQHLVNITSSTPQFVLPCLKEIMTAGEQLQVSNKLRRFFQKMPECTLYNQYGPSESHVVTAFTLPDNPETWPNFPPIGYPIANTKIYILDSQLQPVPIGIPEELYIGGDGLARGYLKHPELTMERFLPNPFDRKPGDRLYKTGDLARYLPDGNIEFLGRRDHQVKLRGFRIELGEIETVLTRYPNVRETVVLLREDSPGEKRLVAYVVGAKDKRQKAKGKKQKAEGRRQRAEGSNGKKADTETATVAELREHLKRTLPEHMIPSTFVFLDALPLTPNGKVDRCALPAPDINRPESEPFMAPRDHIERQLVQIWQRVLSIHPIGIRDNFFDLGGHSLLAGKLLFELKKALDIRLPLITIFQAPTIEQQADMIRQKRVTTPFYSLIPVQEQGTLPPLFFVYPLGPVALHYTTKGTHELAKCLGKDQPIYGLRYGLAVTCDPEHLPFSPDFKTLAEHLIDEIQKVQPQGPYFLCGRSSSGPVAFEMARQLYQQGQTVAMLVVLDTPHPLGEKSCPGALKKRLRYSLKSLFHAPVSWMKRFNTYRFLYRNKHQGASLISTNLAALYQLGSFWAYRLRKLPRHNSIPETYPGKLIFFECEELSGPWESRWGWELSSLGGVEVVKVPGWHGNMMEEESNLIVLAEKLRLCLKRAQEGKETDISGQIVEWEPLPRMLSEHEELLNSTTIFAPGLLSFGIAQDFWMQREAVLSLSPDPETRELEIRFESHAPARLHPISLSFENEQEEHVHTHVITQPEISETTLELSHLFRQSSHVYLKIRCDITFIPHQEEPTNPDTRELGVRMVAGRYI